MPARRRIYACLPIPSAGAVTLGFAFARAGRRRGAARAAATGPGPPRRGRPRARDRVAGHGTGARRAARGRGRSASTFVSTVAHELRTPLTGLSGYLDLILDGQVDDPAIEREFLERGRTIVGSMTAPGRRPARAVAARIGYAGPRDRSRSPSPRRCTPSTPALMPIALDRGVPLVTTPPPRLRDGDGRPPARRADPHEPRRQRAQVRRPTAARSSWPAGSTGPVAIIAVRDEGPGIDAEDRARIFERFYRMADHERVTGTGLGLPIARDLARPMGGDLDVASRARRRLELRARPARARRAPVDGRRDRGRDGRRPSSARDRPTGGRCARGRAPGGVDERARPAGRDAAAHLDAASGDRRGGPLRR